MLCWKNMEEGIWGLSGRSVAGAHGISVSEGLSHISRTASCCFFFCSSSSTFFSASVLRRSSRLPMSLLTCSMGY